MDLYTHLHNRLDTHPRVRFQPRILISNDTAHTGWYILVAHRSVMVVFDHRRLLSGDISLVTAREEEASREKREKTLEEEGESGEP